MCSSGDESSLGRSGGDRFSAGRVVGRLGGWNLVPRSRSQLYGFVIDGRINRG